MKETNQKLSHKGMGSFFSYINNDALIFSEKRNANIPSNHKLFYNGRQAIKYIIKLINKDCAINNFWIPEYYCQHVTSWLQSEFSNIKTYPINPKNKSFSINLNNFVEDNDVVMLNNFWGISHCLRNETEKKVIIIEDHSHGWLSESCLNSKADYCFASLRKTIPVPLGGIVWSPLNNKLFDINYETSNFYENMWENILLGMKMKSEFEKSRSIIEKETFLNLVYNAETKMHENHQLVNLKPKHKKILEDYLCIEFNVFKRENMDYIMSKLIVNNNFNIIISDAVVFGLILHFKNKAPLDKFRNYLISQNIFPSTLWEGNNPKYGFYLNIHVDFRYQKEDLDYLINSINNYVKSNNKKFLN